MTVFGWDASDFDWPRGPMDMVAAHQAGINFFTHKASEGTSVRHSRFGEAMQRARSAGIPILGAYHVVRSPPNAAAEVDYFLSYVNSAAPWWRDFPNWFWQVDLEKWPYDAVPPAEGEQFADIIQQRTGRMAIIYASKGQYGNELAGTSHELWNANYGNNPVAEFKVAYAQRGGDSGPGWVQYSGKFPVFWQYGSRTTIGRQPTCDANAYRGTLAQLVALIQGVDVTAEQVWNYPLPFTQPDGTVETPTAAGVVLRYALYRAWRAEQLGILTNSKLNDLAALDADAVADALAGNEEFIASLADAVAKRVSGGTIALSGTYQPAPTEQRQS